MHGYFHDLPVSIDDILEAKQRLAGKYINGHASARIILANAARGNIPKFENMQRTGSFKIRGAFNKLCGLTAAENAKGWWPGRRATMRRGLALLRHARH